MAPAGAPLHNLSSRLTKQRHCLHNATLQCEQLQERVKGLRLLTGLWQMDRLRRHVAAVGKDVERGQSTLIADVKPQAFAHPFEIREKKKRS